MGLIEDDIIGDGSASEASDTQQKTKKESNYPMTVLSVTTVGALLATIQASALLIVLPDMMSSLHMSFMTMLWVLLIYLMVTTIMVPVLGRISDMIGRKKIYVLGFVVFTVGSLLCGFSGFGVGGWDLVAFRVVQALGGSMLLANSMAMITDAFKKGKLGFGLGVNGVASSAGFVIGPVIGGILAPFGWEWVFLINVPLGIIGTAWAAYRLREPKWEVKKQKFDYLGTVAFFIGLFGILTAATYISFGDPSYNFIVYVMSVIGIIGIIAFLYIELRAEYPMMDLHLFKERNYAVGNFTNLLNGLCIGAATFLLIFYFQGARGMDALTAGLMLIPSGLPMVIVGPLSGRLSDKYGHTLLTAGGLALTTIAMAGLAFIGKDTSLWYVSILMIIMSVGGGMFMSPNASSVMASVPPERRGIASGARIMLRNTGQMFSLAIAFPLVLAGLTSDQMVSIFLGLGQVSEQAIAALQHGLSEAFLIFAAISLVSVIVALMKSGKGNVEDRSMIYSILIALGGLLGVGGAFVVWLSMDAGALGHITFSGWGIIRDGFDQQILGDVSSYVRWMPLVALIASVIAAISGFVAFIKPIKMVGAFALVCGVVIIAAVVLFVLYGNFSDHIGSGVYLTVAAGLIAVIFGTLRATIK